MNEIKKSWARIATLEKRLRWLENRIEYSDGDMTYDKAEASALRWAIPILIQVRDKAHEEYLKGVDGDSESERET